MRTREVNLQLPNQLTHKGPAKSTHTRAWLQGNEAPAAGASCALGPPSSLPGPPPHQSSPRLEEPVPAATCSSASPLPGSPGCVLNVLWLPAIESFWMIRVRRVGFFPWLVQDSALMFYTEE